MIHISFARSAALLLAVPCLLFGQENRTGAVTGVVRADSTGESLASVNVSLVRFPDRTVVTGTVTDPRGAFRIENVPAGEYRLRYSLLGYLAQSSRRFLIDSSNRSFDAGTVSLRETALTLPGITVTSEMPVLNMAVDRKVYNVQQDIISKTGSVSDLLQNIPSVQVDVDGTVSLRGSTNVQILINGKPSPMIPSGSSDLLQQIPATNVDRIEVITNPSAKFKPEGTAGLINVVLKKESDLGINGTLGANAGNDSRYNVSVTGNYRPGDLNIFGTYSFRQDVRNTHSTDIRQQLSSTTNQLDNFNQYGLASARPYSHFATLGMEYRAGEADRVGVTGNFRRRGYTSNDISTYLLTDNSGLVTSNYDRLRIDYDQTPVGGATVFYQHDFEKDDHTLRLEATGSRLFDEEDNHFTNVFRIPPGFVTYDNRRIREYDDKAEITADYHWKITDHSIFEAGYDGTFEKDDFPFTGNYFDTTQHAFVIDNELTNHFVYNEAIHAFYATYAREFGPISIMGGLRLERAHVNSDLITTGTFVPNNYWRLYPTLHITDRLNDFNEIQLNYSLRVNRPDSDDLNPFPEAQNPRNLRAGNPYLKPEYIHSIELGLQIQNKAISFVPGIFYRNRYNGFTWVTSSLNDSTLLTTHENLGSDQSGGLELVVTGTAWGIFGLNLSANAFYEEIDASDIGFGSRKSTVSWNGTLNCNAHVAQGTMIQVNTNYHSSHLTPQGDSSPNFVMNMGFRQDLLDERLSLVATISDVFATLKRESRVNTSWLAQNSNFYRDSRVAFIGLTYHFGVPPKQRQDKPLQYDDSE